MSKVAEALLEQAKKLPPEDRAMVAERLLETLDPENEIGVEGAWTAEATARAEEAERDPSVLVDWAEVKADIERVLGKK